MFLFEPENIMKSLSYYTVTTKTIQNNIYVVLVRYYKNIFSLLIILSCTSTVLRKYVLPTLNMPVQHTYPLLKYIIYTGNLFSFIITNTFSLRGTYRILFHSPILFSFLNCPDFT